MGNFSSTFEIEELKKQNQALRNVLREKEAIIKNAAIDEKTSGKIIDEEKRIQMTRIEKYVEDLINNKEVNIDYLPDFVERQIYKNTLSFVINLLEHILDSVELNVMGARVKVKVE